MPKISTPGSDEGSILVDVVVSLLLITLTLFPFYTAYQNLIRAEEKQNHSMERVLTLLNGQESWHFTRQDNEE